MTRGRPVTCSFPGPRGGAASVVPKLRRFVPKSAPHAHTRGGRATGTWRQAGTQPRALPAAAARTQRGGSDASPPHTEAAGMDAKRAPGRDSAEGGKGGLGDFVSALPPEITSRIFSGLDVESLCHASVTCKGWHRVIESNEQLWRHHCLAVRAVCQREIDCDRRNGYSWKITLLRNYWKSKVKQEWLSGKYSNIPSQFSLPEKSMYPMDVDTWGEILEAELER
ncbi:F-box only protein 48 isoform X2 [Motacilla alba alba]|nr:F-box only protein 48 isoform X2 [Motacilla alba alba]